MTKPNSSICSEPRFLEVSRPFWATRPAIFCCGLDWLPFRWLKSGRCLTPTNWARFYSRNSPWHYTCAIWHYVGTCCLLCCPKSGRMRFKVSWIPSHSLFLRIPTRSWPIRHFLRLEMTRNLTPTGCRWLHKPLALLLFLLPLSLLSLLAEFFLLEAL